MYLTLLRGSVGGTCLSELPLYKYSERKIGLKKGRPRRPFHTLMTLFHERLFRCEYGCAMPITDHPTMVQGGPRISRCTTKQYSKKKLTIHWSSVTVCYTVAIVVLLPWVSTAHKSPRNARPKGLYDVQTSVTVVRCIRCSAYWCFYRYRQQQASQRNSSYNPVAGVRSLFVRGRT